VEKRTRLALVGSLIVSGAAARLLPHPANVTPVTAMALLGGAALEGAWAYAVPLGILALSDLFLGFHSTMLFVYAGFLLTARLGRGLREAGAGKLAASSAASSVTFFALTNFGVWAAAGLYPRTGAGLAACYAAAVPFFRNALLGDLAWTFALFGAVRLAERFTAREGALAAS
jgi:hypothetical protein